MLVILATMVENEENAVRKAKLLSCPVWHLHWTFFTFWLQPSVSWRDLELGKGEGGGGGTNGTQTEREELGTGGGRLPDWNREAPA